MATSNSKRPFPNRYIFEKIDTEEKAYWLGFLYADGSVGSTEDKVELSLAACDVDHIKKFKNFIGLDNKISYREKLNAYRYSFRDKVFKEILIRQGCTPKKSLTLRFPTEEQVPRNLIRHFIRGYFDGDGCFCNTNYNFSVDFISTKNFIEGCLQVLPNNLNKNLTIKDVHRKDGAKRYGFYGFNDVSVFLDFIYKDCNIYLDRKYQKYLDFLNQGSNRHKNLKYKNLAVY